MLVRVLVCHNYYARRSGEETVVEQEMALLQEYGHRVELFSYDNASVEEGSIVERFDAGLRAIYSRRTEREVRRFLREKSFDVAHVHNTYGLMSPSIYKALRNAGLPVVKTVHNFRWLCPIGTFYRDGHVCQDCVDRPGGLIHGVLNRCFHDSLSGSMVAASRLLVNRDLLKIMHGCIDVMIVQNTFVRDILIRYGFPPESMQVKGNFLRRVERVPINRGDYGVFFGRLEPLKGLGTLLDGFQHAQLPLRVFGQGPMAEWIKTQIAERFGGDERVRFEGYAPRSALVEAIAGARAVIFPSEWYESYPITIVEAMAFGKPVIASNLGSIPLIVRDEVNGLLFRPGNSVDLAEKIRRLWQDDDLQRRLESGAKATYEAEMSPDRNYGQLLQIYESAIASRRGRKRRDPD